MMNFSQATTAFGAIMTVLSHVTGIKIWYILTLVCAYRYLHFILCKRDLLGCSSETMHYSKITSLSAYKDEYF
jgi:hypothetical protein